MAELAPRVLVVDDERFFREAVSEALAEAGIDCETCESGERALELARDPRIGVVVLDIALADLSGIEVLRRLRGERPALRVIMLSAHADQDLVLEALRLDASDYLAKPLHDEELVLAVRRALGGFGVEASWERLREKLRRLDAGLASLAEASGREAVAQAAAHAAADVLGATRTSVMLFDESTEQLRVWAATGSPLDPEKMDPVALGEGIAGWALAHGEALIVDDIYTDSRLEGRRAPERYETPSLAVAPLGARPGPCGVLCATDREGGAPFADDDLALLRILALQVGRQLVETPPVPPAAAEASGEGGSEELARAICEAVTTLVEPERVISGVLRPIAARLDGPVALYLVDNPSGELVCEGQVDDAGAGQRDRLPRDRGLTGSTLQTGALVATDVPSADPRFDSEVDTPLGGAELPILCVPLRLRGRVLGLLRAFPAEGAEAVAGMGEWLAPVVSAAVRSVLLYRSLLEAIDEVADVRREVEGQG